MRRDILSYFKGLYEGPVVHSQNLIEPRNSLTALLARDGVVGTVTRLWAGDKRNRVCFQQEQGISLLSTISRHCGAHLALHSTGTRGSFLESKAAVE
jgi:hypothetical protein